MTDEEKRSSDSYPRFRETFFNEADQLCEDLDPLAEMMRRHPSVVRQIMRTEHLALSAGERALLLGKIPA